VDDAQAARLLVSLPFICTKNPTLVDAIWHSPGLVARKTS
jgi:hypothetical protein